MFGIIVSFKDFKLPSPRATNIISDIFSREWVGLDNFGQLFSSPTTWQFMKNTIVYNAIFIVLGLVLAVAFAILISELTTKFLAKTYQTLMFFPYFLSWVVVSYFVWAFLSPTAGLWRDGFVNSLGMSAWYNDAKPWPFILVIANLWKNTGYSCILYLAAITGIDTSQYEAARIDGANKWQQIWHITLPHLRTIIIILFIMNVGRIFNADFGLFYQVPRGGAGALTKATEVVDTYVYKMLKDTINIGVSTAVGFFQNIVGFVCIMVANTIVRKVDPDSAMF
jgi:putative aldouronate transport system permease protein